METFSDLELYDNILQHIDSNWKVLSDSMFDTEKAKSIIRYATLGLFHSLSQK